MKNRTMFLMLVLGSLLIGLGACTNNEGSPSSSDGPAMDSASMAERAKDELTLLILKNKKQDAERNANQAASNVKEAIRIERDAMDAARLAEDALRTEEKAQKARHEADDQAERAEKASDKANEN